MMMVATAVRLGPRRARLGLSGPAGARLRRGRRRAGGAPTAAEIGRFLTTLAGGSGLDAACLAAGLNRGDVLLARARDPRFAEAWDMLGEAKRAAIESALLDRGMEALRRPPVPPEPGGALGLDKTTLGVLQGVVGGARATRGARAEAKPVAPAAAPEPALDAAEAEALIAEALVQLAAAEAALAAEGVEAERR